MERLVHCHNAGRWLRVEPSWHRGYGPIHESFGRSRWPSSCNCTHQLVHTNDRRDDGASDRNNGRGNQHRYLCSNPRRRGAGSWRGNARRDAWR